MIDTENCIGECSPCAKRVLCRAQFIISDKIVFLVSIVVLFTIDVSWRVFRFYYSEMFQSDARKLKESKVQQQI